MTLVTDALVRSVLVDEHGHAKGVAYVDRATQREIEVLCESGGAGGLLRRDRAHHAELALAPLAYGYRQFQRSGGP